MGSESFQSNVEKTIAIVVLYKRHLEDSETIQSLENCLKRHNLQLDLFVYDNSPEPMLNERNINTQYWRIHYRHDKTNPGVSRAYNEGAKIGKMLDKQWLLLLDQDTIFPDDALRRYYDAVANYSEVQLFVPMLVTHEQICSPCKYFLKRAAPLTQISAGMKKIKYISVLNSGLLVSLQAFEIAGGFNENIRLDYSDYDFFDRFKNKHKWFVVIDCICQHNLFCITHDDVQNTLTRFSSFCEGAFLYSKNPLDFFLLLPIVINRAVKLSIKYGDFRFFKLFLLKYLLGKKCL